MIRSLVMFTFTTSIALTLSSCSMFSRKTQETPGDWPKAAATPLDMPADKNADKTADAGHAPLPAQESSPGVAEPAPSSLGGPQVTLLHKDGTPIEAAETTAAAPASAIVAAAHSGKNEKSIWSYEGDRGPEHWGDMKTSYANCRDGKAQSPVDLKWHKPKTGGHVTVMYKATPARVEDTGHTVQATMEAGSHIKYDGKVYDLMAIQFHSPSEHALSGKTFPMEVHFINQDQSGNVVILASFLAQGKQNATIGKVWGALGGSPSPEGDSTIALNPAELLPAQPSHYEYEGSLTTPPCTENVKWVIFNNPIHASDNQITAFHHLYRANARPLQALNGRDVVNF